MSNVEFDENQEAANSHFMSRTILGSPRIPGMASWLLKRGIIKNEHQAQRVLLGIVMFNVLVTIFLIVAFL